VSKALRQAGEALSKALGSVDRMFEEGALTNGLSSRFGSTFYKVLPLHPDIKNLSAEVMEVLLGSDTLQLRSENDAHYLLCAWLSQDLYSRLVPRHLWLLCYQRYQSHPWSL